MGLHSSTIIFLFTLITIHCSGQASKSNQSKDAAKVEFINHEAEKRIDVMIDGKLFTSYCWPENVYKPILYPVSTSAGTEITRGFPLKPRKGERNDHIHQVGIWMNYGNVNGHDFWGNGYRGVKEPNGGEIKHLSVEKTTGGPGEGILITRESWVDPAGKEIFSERTEYHFIANGSVRIIDRLTKLTAGDTSVVMKDTKEGMFGIRVARQLELPSNEALILIDSTGKAASKKVTTNEGVTGNYRSSEGVSGEAVWGTRAKWMALDGIIGNEKISLVICDHPKNQSYPTYWHARGYGLFAANPLGWSDFTKGKEVLNLTIPPGKSVTFRYRVIVSSGNYLTDYEINTCIDDFAKRY
jgi:hypothetical protein